MLNLLVAKAITAPDKFALRVEYEDRLGQRTIRTISPIRFGIGKKLIAHCLGRDSVRTFKLESIVAAKLVDSGDVLIPERIINADFVRVTNGAN